MIEKVTPETFQTHPVWWVMGKVGGYMVRRHESGQFLREDGTRWSFPQDGWALACRMQTNPELPPQPLRDLPISEEMKILWEIECLLKMVVTTPLNFKILDNAVQILDGQSELCRIESLDRYPVEIIRGRRRDICRDSISAVLVMSDIYNMVAQRSFPNDKI